MSVVIPTHNRSEFVGEAVRSVLNQSVRPREVIVVDDCSDDETEAVLAEFGGSIRVMRTPSNVERGRARNLGASLATGDVLAFLDSDDVWRPDKLQRQLSQAQPDGPSVTGIAFIDEVGRDLGKAYSPAPSWEEEIVVNNLYLGSPSTLMIPRVAFDEVGGFPEPLEYQGSEDWILLVKLLWSGWRMRVVREPLVLYRIHPGGWTQRPQNLERSMWAACSWLDRQGLGSPRLAAIRRGRAAAAIACAYLVHRDWRSARRWEGVALREGDSLSRLHGAWRMARGAFTGVAARRTNPAGS